MGAAYYVRGAKILNRYNSEHHLILVFYSPHSSPIRTIRPEMPSTTVSKFDLASDEMDVPMGHPLLAYDRSGFLIDLEFTTPLPTSDSDSDAEKTDSQPEAPKSFRIGVAAGYKIVFTDNNPLPKIEKERSRKRKNTKSDKPKNQKKAKNH